MYILSSVYQDRARRRLKTNIKALAAKIRQLRQEARATTADARWRLFHQAGWIGSSCVRVCDQGISPTVFYAECRTKPWSSVLG